MKLHNRNDITSQKELFAAVNKKARNKRARGRDEATEKSGWVTKNEGEEK